MMNKTFLLYKDYRQQGQTVNPPVDIRKEFAKVEEDFGVYAENVIKELVRINSNMKTNQIRNILSMIIKIQNQELNKSGDLSEQTVNDLRYLKVRLAYTMGRDADGRLGTRNFIEKSHLSSFLPLIGKNRKYFDLYCLYLEALVAYHKYHIKER